MPDGQPATEAVFGAPLQIRDHGQERVVAIRGRAGRLVVLKRFDTAASR